MGIPNKDEVKGKYEATVGAVKEKVGHVIDDKEMEHQAPPNDARRPSPNGRGRSSARSAGNRGRRQRFVARRSGSSGLEAGTELTIRARASMHSQMRAHCFPLAEPFASRELHRPWAGVGQAEIRVTRGAEYSR